MIKINDYKILTCEKLLKVGLFPVLKRCNDPRLSPNTKACDDDATSNVVMTLSGEQLTCRRVNAKQIID